MGKRSSHCTVCKCNLTRFTRIIRLLKYLVVPVSATTSLVDRPLNVEGKLFCSLKCYDKYMRNYYIEERGRI